ncbi:A1 cistron-splicing factor AAR2, partial [Tremellales sp. Uapishka_1]
MNNLTPEQAEALFHAGGFLVLSGLPESSEFGIDGTFHVVRRFSGIKFLTPGLHLVTWSPPSSSEASTDNSGPPAIYIRSAFLHAFEPRERVVLAYDTKSETIPLDAVSAVISDDHLRSLDGELAPYPFEGLAKWKALTGQITQPVIDAVLGEDGRVDGLTPVEGEEEDERAQAGNGVSPAQGAAGEKTMKFPRFDLKKSWRAGAVGEEVTRFARDKSWLLGNVVHDRLGNNPLLLVAHLQLAFILLLHLSNFSSLLVYKRYLALLCRASSALKLPTSLTVPMRSTYISLLHTLASQLSALPRNAFDAELVEMDIFYLDELEALRLNLIASLGAGSLWKQDEERLRSAWQVLKNAAARSFDWDVGDLVSVAEESDEEEQGEYAPVVVDT